LADAHGVVQVERNAIGKEPGDGNWQQELCKEGFTGCIGFKQFHASK
jgi:hypothetical protein